MAVTPVRTGPLPISSLPSPEISVVWPTSTPFTSVMALLGPGVPSKGTPRSRARGLVCATRAVARPAVNSNVVRRVRNTDIQASNEKEVYGIRRGGLPRRARRPPGYNRSERSNLERETMDSWKKAVVLGAIGTAAVLFIKKRYPLGVLATGVSLAMLAS